MAFNVTEAKRAELFSAGQYLVTKVSFEVMDEITSWILNNRPAKKEFCILINSEGGEPRAILTFASFLATLDPSVKITGVAFGECGSAALALLQCCHHRIGVRHCGFFIHHAWHKFQRNGHDFNLRNIKAELEQIKEIEEELVRLQAKRCGMTRAAWMKLADQGEEISNRAILPVAALKLGLIDRVVDQYSIF